MLCHYPFSLGSYLNHVFQHFLKKLHKFVWVCQTEGDSKGEGEEEEKKALLSGARSQGILFSIPLGFGAYMHIAHVFFKRLQLRLKPWSAMQGPAPLAARQ